MGGFEQMAKDLEGIEYRPFLGESQIVINGKVLTESQSATVREALSMLSNALEGEPLIPLSKEEREEHYQNLQTIRKVRFNRIRAMHQRMLAQLEREVEKTVNNMILRLPMDDFSGATTMAIALTNGMIDAGMKAAIVIPAEADREDYIDSGAKADIIGGKHFYKATRRSVYNCIVVEDVQDLSTSEGDPVTLLEHRYRNLCIPCTVIGFYRKSRLPANFKELYPLLVYEPPYRPSRNDFFQVFNGRAIHPDRRIDDETLFALEVISDDAMLCVQAGGGRLVLSLGKGTFEKIPITDGKITRINESGFANGFTFCKGDAITKFNPLPLEPRLMEYE